MCKALLVKAKQDLPSCTPPTCNRAMDSSVESGRIGGFTGEEQSILYRSRQSLLRTIRADRAVTISPARKRIALPIMKVGGVQQLRNLL
jgi:hypothetical protein